MLEVGGALRPRPLLRFKTPNITSPASKQRMPNWIVQSTSNVFNNLDDVRELGRVTSQFSRDSLGQTRDPPLLN